MRYPPTDEYDQKELKRLNCQPWQIELLDRNPSYKCWGPHEDAMWNESEGWSGRVLKETWKDFGPWSLDELNECANFYFYLHRTSKDCHTCGGNGYHPDAHWVSKSFYGHSTPFRRQTRDEVNASLLMARFGGGMPTINHGFPSDETLSKYGEPFRLFCESMRDGDGEWNDKITDDEAAALVAKNRGYDGAKTASDFNAQQHANGVGHDAINRAILIDARLKRLGVPKTCSECDGHGHVFTEPAGKVGLVLWMLHPRKGASRGVEIAEIQQDEIPAVLEWLKTAAQRNAERFGKL